MEPLEIVMPIATLGLAIITYFYLRETKKMRDVASDSLRIDAAPKIFIQSINTHRDFDKQAKKLFVNATIRINNVGKTEAKNIKIFYEIKIGGSLQIPRQVDTAPHIFPSQSVTFKTLPVFFELNDKDLQIAGEHLEKKEKMLFPPAPRPAFLLLIKIEYIGYKDEPAAVSYLCEYDWECGDWAMSIPPAPVAKA
ncbi:MAG: hypothetical protein ABSG19_14405 [Candidatus Aminicenantales bacterium]